jgi:hypothetical protein
MRRNGMNKASKVDSSKRVANHPSKLLKSGLLGFSSVFRIQEYE